MPDTGSCIEITATIEYGASIATGAVAGCCCYRAIGPTSTLIVTFANDDLHMGGGAFSIGVGHGDPIERVPDARSYREPAGAFPNATMGCRDPVNLPYLLEMRSAAPEVIKGYSRGC